jgi:predicted GNAT family acetyltransferase
VELIHNDKDHRGFFLLQNNGETAAEMTYVWISTERIIIDHTAVSPDYQGQGLGKQLVAKAVEFAREKGITILPLCPFARAIFDRTPEYNDIRGTL